MIMDLKQFIETYKGRGVNWDGVAGVQCVDLIDQYLQDVFGIKPPLVTGARDFYNNFDKLKPLNEYFKKIPNTRELITQRGDIIIWGGGTWGHCAIDDGGGTIDVFYSWEQNTLGKHEPMTLIKHKYNGKGANDYCNPVLGVLRPLPMYQGLVSVYRYLVIYPNGMNIRNQPGVNSTEIVGYLNTGREFTANQVTIIGGQKWAHLITGGWVCVDKKFCEEL